MRIARRPTIISREMGLLIRVLLVALVAYVVYRAVRNAFGHSLGGKSRFKCATCKNCKNLFDDGVICAFGRKETFKNETHIANCHDYERGRAG